MRQIDVPPLPTERFLEIGETEYRQMHELAAVASAALAGRVVWSVNSTARGGGVAELLRSLVAYARGGGVDARWAVIEGSPEFFAVTKRLHNRLHGAADPAGALGERERETYERTLARSGAHLSSLLEPDDVVLLHDCQTAGLVDAVHSTGACAIWRAHVGLDMPNGTARGAWDFLRPYLAAADAYVFHRAGFAWEGLDPGRVTVIPPSIDAFSPKNAPLSSDAVRHILVAAGLLDAPDGAAAFTRTDGSPGRVDRRATVVEERPLRPGERVVLQVSRWDRLKDPIGVLRGFCHHVASETDAHLVLAGPAVEAIADDPEGLEVWREVRDAWASLAPELRARAHLALLPMDDGEENAAIVNALQRHADVVVQKSLGEGFGLTVAEAMWKARPVVASRVGGMQEQVVDGVSGLLLDDATDLAAFGAAVTGLLRDDRRARAIGRAAHERVRESFLGPRHLSQYFELIHRLVLAGRADAQAVGSGT